VLILALALTDETTGIIGAPELAALPDHAWLVNVARGGHVVTGDLVAALADGAIAGAALDVTDPEPLPDDHSLWSAPNCLITPHIANTPEMGVRLLEPFVAENVRRFCAGETLLAPVDVALGY
jgi:D-3-phosphoglycerate dehydrogenase